MFVSFESRVPYALDEKCVSLTSVLTPVRQRTLESVAHSVAGALSKNAPFNRVKNGKSETLRALARSMR